MVLMMKKLEEESKIKGKADLRPDGLAKKPAPFPFKDKEILQVKLTCTLENSGKEKVTTNHPRITRWLLRINPQAKIVVSTDEIFTSIVDNFVRKLTPLQTQNAHWGMLKIQSLVNKHSTTYVLRPRGVYGLLVDEAVPPIDKGNVLSFELFTGDPLAAVRFFLRGIGPQVHGFDRAGKEEMLALVEAAESAFVEPILVQDGMTLCLLSSGDNTDPESNLIAEWFASHTTLVNARPESQRKRKKRAPAASLSTTDEESSLSTNDEE